MFEKQGLRLFMDGMGPGYAFEINTLVSPLTIFIGDVAAEAIKDAERRSKSRPPRGLLAVQYNEADLYGYTDENDRGPRGVPDGRDGMLTVALRAGDHEAGDGRLHVCGEKRVIDLTDPAIAAGTGDVRPADPAGSGRRGSGQGIAAPEPPGLWHSGYLAPLEISPMGVLT
jgi:hypothetical protein